METIKFRMDGEVIILANDKKEEAQSKKIEEESDCKKEKREYQCQVDDCTKIYKSRENLKLHIQNFHQHIKPYSCRYCSLTFSHRNGKTYHERKFHTNYLPYECSCKNNFT